MKAAKVCNCEHWRALAANARVEGVCPFHGRVAIDGRFLLAPSLPVSSPYMSGPGNWPLPNVVITSGQFAEATN